MSNPVIELESDSGFHITGNLVDYGRCFKDEVLAPHHVEILWQNSTIRFTTEAQKAYMYGL